MNRYPKINVLVAVIILSSTSAFAAGEVYNEALNSPMFWSFVLAIVMLLMALFALNKALNTIKWLTYKAQNRPETVEVEEKKESTFMQALTDAVSVENEQDILLDHNYDGIMELDNNLPPWWKYGFYITIVWAVVYFFAAQVLGLMPTQDEEFRTEMAEENAKVKAYIASQGEAVDELNIVALLESSDLKKGENIFTTTCAACHLSDGGGNAIGPNLTDDYWINGDGSISEIFKVVKYGGNEGSGMQSWSGELSAKKMQQVSSFILTLRGTTPAAAKEPQGDFYQLIKEEAAVENNETEETETVVEETIAE